MSGASMLRNAIKRVSHKERSQPKSRQKLGLLEKHRDYIERANDYKKKQLYLKTLRKKAMDRNPDEFYFQMNNSQVKNGQHQNKKLSGVDVATIGLLKTQDLGYISYKKSIDDRKVTQLKQNLHLVGEGLAKKHTFFMSDEDEKHAPGDAPESSTRVKASNALTKSLNLNEEVVSAILRKKKRSYRELRERVRRAQKLGNAYLKLSLQRHLTKKCAKKLRVPAGKQSSADGADKGEVVYKWKRQRTQ